VETGAGLPLRGFWLWRRPDLRFVPGIVSAGIKTATETDPWSAALSLAMAGIRTKDMDMLIGLVLASRWLDEERAAECLRQNAEASK
jgi:hypothetical protein